MEIRRTEENGVKILELEGEIDLHASPALREKLQELVAEKAPAALVDFPP